MVNNVEVYPIDGIESLQLCSKGADVEVTQLRSGRVLGEIKSIDLDEGFVTTAQFDGDVRVRGPMSTDCLSVAVMLGHRGPTNEWGIDVNNGDIGIYPPNYESDSSHLSSLNYSILTISPSTIKHAAVAHELDFDEHMWTRPAFVRPESHAGDEIRKFFSSMKSATDNAALFRSNAVRNALFDESIEKFLIGIANATAQVCRSQSTRWYPFLIVSTAENYLRDRQDLPVRLNALCADINVSRSTLNRAFQTVLNESPISYLRRWRLSQVRTKLAGPTKPNQTVTQAALSFGFWELGRFSHQYYQLFGELPSATLSKARGTSLIVES